MTLHGISDRYPDHGSLEARIARHCMRRMFRLVNDFPSRYIDPVGHAGSLGHGEGK